MVGRRLQRLELVSQRRRLTRPRLSIDAFHSESVWITFAFIGVRLVLAGGVLIPLGLEVSAFGSCCLSVGLPNLPSLVIGRHITFWRFAIAVAELLEKQNIDIVSECINVDLEKGEVSEGRMKEIENSVIERG